jgi:hypothetical protein
LVSNYILFLKTSQEDRREKSEMRKPPCAHTISSRSLVAIFSRQALGQPRNVSSFHLRSSCEKRRSSKLASHS